jgi:HD-GYP domain-containing protein (c-di-GMP phosphodiesterase class II)
MLRVRIRTPTDPEQVRDFTNVRRVTFGRSSDNDLVLEGTYVSRLHGELLRVDEGWCAINHGTRTPLALLRDERRVELAQGGQEILEHGDVLQILHTRMEIELEGGHTATDFGLPFVRDEVEVDSDSSTNIRELPLAAQPAAAVVRQAPPAPRVPPAQRPDPLPVGPEVGIPEHELETAFESFVEAVSAALEARSAVAAGHAQRVAAYTVALARALRRSQLAPEQTLFSDHQLRELRWAALLHDFGLLAVPDAALCDSAPLEAYGAHVEQGAELLQRVAWPAALRGVPALVKLHHERLDGSGYPRGLGADELPTGARLLAVVDLFDAVSSGERPGRAGLAPERAIEVLRREARAGRLDGDLVERERPWSTGSEDDTLS